MVCECGKIAFLGLVSALQHMRKSLNMITLQFLHIHFDPNNTFPQHLNPHVTLFDPIGSPLSLTPISSTIFPHHNFKLFVGQLLIYVLRLDMDWEIYYQIASNKAIL